MSKQSNTVQILIADDHALFRQGLRKLLEEEKGFQVVGEAADGVEAVKLVKALRPDILLLDIQMPLRSGLEALRDLESSASPLRTIVLAAVIENRQIVEALQLGARGIVLKESALEVLFRCIRVVVNGRYWIDRKEVADILRVMRELQPAHSAPTTFGLTQREIQIVARISAGYSNKDIAGEFSISERTVKHHLTNIFDKVGVSSRLELALFAVSHGLPQLETGGVSPDAPVSQSEK